MHRSKWITGILLCASLGLWACGPSTVMEDGSGDFGSRPEPRSPGSTGGGGTGGGSTHGILSTCSGFENNTLQLGGILESYRDPLTGNFISSYIRLRLSEYPSSIHSTGSYYLNFFRWSEDTPGAPVFNDVPVKMYFVLSGTTQFLNRNDPVQSISRSVIRKLIDDHNLDIYGIDPSNFLDHVVVVLTGVEIQYDVVQIRLYNNSASQGYLDVLVPAFSANPNTYAANHPSTALQSLHPNWPVRNSGASDNEFLSYASDACAAFYAASNKSVDTDRLPASLGREGQQVSLWTRFKLELQKIWNMVTGWF